MTLIGNIINSIRNYFRYSSTTSDYFRHKSSLTAVKHEVPFHFKQTGANFKRGEQIYHIPRKDQQEQAAKVKIDYMPPERIRKELYENEEQRYPDLYQLSLPL